MLEEIDKLFQELESITRELDRLVYSGESDIARELIVLRRRYADTNGRANALVEERICGPLRNVPAAAPLIREFHAHANEARSMVADHQARWPASGIAAQEGEYRRSVSALSEMHVRHNRWRRHGFLPEAEKLLEAR